MPKLFHFEVHTPYRLFFSGSVESVSLTLLDGEIGIYANHTPFTAPVLSCLLHVRDEHGLERPAFITDGILEVTDFKTMLLVDAAEWPQEIDVERALNAKDEAEIDLESATFRFEINSVKARLRRAEYRIKAAALRGEE